MKLCREGKSPSTRILRITPSSLKTEYLIAGTPSAVTTVALGITLGAKEKKEFNNKNEKHDKMAFGVSSVRPSLPGKCPGGYGRPVADVVSK
jgi:hypothetical protein